MWRAAQGSRKCADAGSENSFRGMEDTTIGLSAI